MDRREEILDRLRAILAETPGIITAARNVENIDGGPSTRPAAVLYDGAENNADYANRPKFSPKEFVTMVPQIIIFIGARAENVGTRINDIRRQLIPLVYNDQIIRDICTKGGDIQYLSGALDTATGETREARFEIKFDITYPLDSRELETF